MICQIKFSKYQALFSIVLCIVMYEPVMDVIRQWVLFHDYRWLILAVIIISYIFWNFIRITILMILGHPAIILSKNDITLTQLGYTIEWKDIEEMNLVVTYGKSRSYNLVIDVKDPWKYISQIKNPLVRYYCWYAKDYYYKPFSINLITVEGDNEEIFDSVDNYFHKIRHMI